MAKDPGSYSKKEAQARFEAALRGGLKTQPTPLKNVPAKREPTKRKGKKPGK